MEHAERALWVISVVVLACSYISERFRSDHLRREFLTLLDVVEDLAGQDRGVVLTTRVVPRDRAEG